MTNPDFWGPFGGEYRRMGRAPANRAKMPLDPIVYAGLLLYIQVLAGMKSCKWLVRSISIVNEPHGKAFERHVKPTGGSAKTTNSSWSATIKELVGCGVLEATTGFLRKSFGKLFVVAKGLSGKGRAIFDFSDLNRKSARPFPPNLPHIPSLLERVGSYRHKEGWTWKADWKNFFYLLPITARIRHWFCILLSRTEVFWCKVAPQGWSWSPTIAISVGWGIVLGDMPPALKKLIDWSILDRDTPPCWVPLVREGREIGIILLWFDDLIIFCEEKEIVDMFRTHVMRRSAMCNAPFKCEKDENGEWKTVNPITGQPEPEHPKNHAEFLGLFFLFWEDRWIYRHKDTSSWDTEIPKEAPRRKYASIVGTLVWDSSVFLETLERIDPGIDVLRRITAGVKTRAAWAEHVALTVEEVEILKSLTTKAVNRGWNSIPDTLQGSPRKYVFVAADASKSKVAYVKIPTLCPGEDEIESWLKSFIRGEDFDFGNTEGKHIFFSELQAATWAIIEMCKTHKDVVIVIATDNSAVFHVLRRGFSGVKSASDSLKLLREAMQGTGNSFHPVLIPGVHNVADCPTRDAKLCGIRMALTHAHLEAAVQGGGLTLNGWKDKRQRDMDERVRIEEAPSERTREDEAPEDILDEEDAFLERDTE